MNSKLTLTFSTLLAVLLIAFSQVSVAESIELTVFPDEISVCPCSAITPHDVAVSARNLHHSSDTYVFTLDAPQGWSSQIQHDVTLGSGEEADLDLFLINVGCDVSPGVYTATVSAKSQTRGETVSKTLDIEVLLCRGVELTVFDDKQDVCFEEPVPLTYNVEIKNLGKFKETFDLTSSVTWADFSDSEITLGSGEITTLTVTLDPEGVVMGSHEVAISARSTDPGSPSYYLPVTKTLGLKVNDCYDFSVDMQPNENTVCSGKSVEYTLIIENTGLNNDVYSVFTPDWISSEETDVSLEPGQTTNVVITATPGTSGSSDVTVTVSSTKDTGLSKKAASTVNAQECRSVAVIVSPTEYKVCSGMDPVAFDVSVKNTGTIEDEFQLTTSHGVLGTGNLVLDAGQIKTTTLEIDPTGLDGEMTVTVTATDGVVADGSDIHLVVENCYSANLTISPEVQSVCPYDSAEYMITLENTGKLPDMYTLRYGDNEDVLDLKSGESESFDLEFLVPFEEAGIYVVSTFANSDEVSLTQTAALNVKTFESCYNVEIVSDGEKRIKPCTLEECDATTFEVEIRNTGDKPAFYNLVLEAPEWIQMEPTALDLGPGESGFAYLYLSPDFGVEENRYPVIIKAKSQYIELNEVVDIVVTQNVEDPAEHPDISLNVSTGKNITGAVIGGDRPLWKTVVVAIIAIIIIIILAIRFILLVKK